MHVDINYELVEVRSFFNRTGTQLLPISTTMAVGDINLRNKIVVVTGGASGLCMLSTGNNEADQLD